MSSVEPFDMTSWQRPERQGSSGGLGYDLLKLTPGVPVRIRVLNGRVTKRFVHFESVKDKTVICPGDGCLFCSRGDKGAVRNYVNVLDRQDNKVKVLAYSQALGADLAALIAGTDENPGEGDPRLYDVQIIRTGKGKETRYAVAKIGEKGALDVTTYQLVDLEKALAPMTIEEQRNLQTNRPQSPAGSSVVGDLQALKRGDGGVQVRSVLKDDDVPV